ncbi:hypothetical protein [Streptomyces chattanoogensis]|uniref:hypothetical protein n=1 Tax=Streptomyces chattanoogensis TaxID=66876 RepID=UPI0036BA7AB0
MTASGCPLGTTRSMPCCRCGGSHWTGAASWPPPRTRWLPPGRVGLLRNAKLYEALSDYRTAAEQYGRAAGARPADTYTRIVALDLVAGAEMQLKHGQTEQACATWNRALEHMDLVRSVRTRKAVTRMRGVLARFRARGAYAARPSWTNVPLTSSPAPDRVVPIRQGAGQWR